MKIGLSSVAAATLVVVLGSVQHAEAAAAGKIIPRSLSKAALSATKQNRSLRKKEQLRAKRLAAEVQPKSPWMQRRRKLEDGEEVGDDADANGYSQWYNYDGDYDLNDDMNVEAFGFDITSYSFHYTGCSAIKAYDDTMAADGSSASVLKTQRMATFRLCPSDSCNSKSYDGCSDNYGEYVVSMDDFLISMIQLQEDRVTSYCEYCQECASMESFKSFYSELQYKYQMVLQSSQTSYESFAENYKANYGSNNAYGDDGGGGGDDDLVAAKAYYQKLTRGNYANNYVYGNAYNNNYYGQSGNGGYNYQNQNQKNYNYNNNQYNNNNNAAGDDASNNYNYDQYSNNNQYNGDDQTQNYNNNQYQSNGNGGGWYKGKYYDADAWATLQESQQSQTSKNQQLWKTWWSFSTSSSGNNNYNNQNQDNQQNQENNEAQSYSNFYSNMNSWSNMGAWYGHKIVNGYTETDEYGNEAFIPEWGFIGYDNVFHSLEDEAALTEWDEDAYGFALPEGWTDYLAQGEDLQSCAYDSSSSCYNQFFSCMQLLNQDEYQEFIEEYNSAYYETMYEEAEEAKERATITDFLSCTAIDFDGDINNDDKNDDGQKYTSYANDDGSYSFYVGPHCDGDVISLAVYTDEYCSNYASGVALADIIGYDPMEGGEFSFVPNECISCAYDELTEKWYENEEIDGADDGIEPMCSMLYQFSGKCNKNLSPSTTYSNNYAYNANGGSVDESWLLMYQSDSQYLNEDSVCSYIDSLRSNTYDEDGEVVLDSTTSWNPSQWKKEVSIQSRVMQQGLKVGLVVSALAAFSMAVAALVLHGMLARKNIPWRPSRKSANPGEDPTDIARQNSGIVTGRSRSAIATTPLI